MISLDCSVRSQLRWEQALERANACRARGVLILWQLNTGIFQNGFCAPDEGTLNSVLRGLEHFTRQIWPPFANNTLCCALQGGRVPPVAQWSWLELSDFMRSCPEDAEMQLALRSLEKSAGHKRDLASALQSLDALNLSECATDYQFDLMYCTWRALASVLPESAPAGILLDLLDLTPAHQLYLTTGERAEDLLPIARTQVSQITSLDWNRLGPQGSLWFETEPQELATSDGGAISLALGLPCKKSDQLRWQALAKASQILEKLRLAYRIVPVSSLREHWQELDFVIATFETEGSLGRRQLEGFCAAGGTVLNVQEPMRLELELPFWSWFEANFLKKQASQLREVSNFE